MWQVTAYNLKMAEGDYGIRLPVTVSGTTFAERDSISITIKDKNNGSTILEKTFSNIQQNTFNLEFTEEESALLPVGTYVYVMDWYQDGAFMCNVIQSAPFEVVDKG